MVARDHAGDDQRRMLGFVTLTDEILVRSELALNERQPANFGDILLCECGVLAQVPDQHVMRFFHVSRSICPAKNPAGSIK